MNMVPWIGAIAAGYLVGSVPFGYVLGKLRGVDIREHGSGNVGATNVARVLGYPMGILVFLLDVGKGLVSAGLLPGLIGGEDYGILPIVCGAAAILGHVFPVFLRFKGGRGVATGCGVIAWLLPIPAAIALGVWITVAVVTKYVSAASVVAACSVPISLVCVHCRELSLHLPELIFALLITALVVVRHIPNIKRLIAGTENKLAKRSK